MSLLRLFWLCLRTSLFTFGGGAAVVPLIQQSLVAEGFMTLEESVDMLAVSQMTPGPFAVNAATFAGAKLAGWPGAALATLGMVLPSVLLTLLIAKFFFSFHQRPAVKAALAGVRPVTLALITGSVFLTAGQALWGSAGVDLPACALAAAVFTALWRTKISPVWLLTICGGVGALFLR